MAGIRRRVDPMRRVTIPSEMADKYNIRPGDEVEVLDQGEGLAIKTIAKRCLFCSGDLDLVPVKGQRICLVCLNEASQQAEKVGMSYTAHLRVLRRQS